MSLAKTARSSWFLVPFMFAPVPDLSGNPVALSQGTLKKMGFGRWFPYRTLLFWGVIPEKNNMQTSGTISRHHRIMEMVGKHTPFFWETIPSSSPCYHPPPALGPAACAKGCGDPEDRPRRSTCVVPRRSDRGTCDILRHPWGILWYLDLVRELLPETKWYCYQEKKGVRGYWTLTLKPSVDQPKRHHMFFFCRNVMPGDEQLAVQNLHGLQLEISRNWAPKTSQIFYLRWSTVTFLVVPPWPLGHKNLWRSDESQVSMLKTQLWVTLKNPHIFCWSNQ